MGIGSKALRRVRPNNKAIQPTVILVTHNPSLAKTADRIVELRDGMVIDK